MRTPSVLNHVLPPLRPAQSRPSSALWRPRFWLGTRRVSTGVDEAPAGSSDSSAEGDAAVQQGAECVWAEPIVRVVGLDTATTPSQLSMLGVGGHAPALQRYADAHAAMLVDTLASGAAGLRGGMGGSSRGRRGRRSSRGCSGGGSSGSRVGVKKDGQGACTGCRCVHQRGPNSQGRGGRQGRHFYHSPTTCSSGARGSCTPGVPSTRPSCTPRGRRRPTGGPDRGGRHGGPP